MATTKKTKPATESANPVDPAPVPVFPVETEEPAPEPDTTPAEAAPAKPVAPILLVTTAAPAAKEVSMDSILKERLLVSGVSQAAIAVLEDEELVTEAALRGMTEQGYLKLGIKTGSREALLRCFGPETKSKVASVIESDDEDETEPMAPAEFTAAAAQYGMDPNMAGMMMMGLLSDRTGMALDMSGMVSVPAIVAEYTPKHRNFPYLVMGQLQASLNDVPIVVINEDGSVNAVETTKYIMSLQEGFPPADDNVYYDESGTPYELIKVGVDAQSIYDSDPVDSSRPLNKSGMGIGNIRWNGVPLDVRQVVYFATQSGELSAGNESKLQWLRDHIKPGVTKSALRLEFPKALVLWREASRTGTLPMLKGQLSRTPRKPEVMPRRRADAGFRDTSGTGTRI